MTEPRTGQSGNWDRERADRLQEDVERMQKDVERLERWKVEAIEVMSGLRELGKALGLGLGVQITGPAALAEVERLTAERDALAQVKRHVDEVRNGTGWTVEIGGVLLQQCDEFGKTLDTHRAERAEAEVERLTRVIDAKPRQPLVVLNEYLDRTEKAEAEVARLTALVQSTEDKADDYLAEIESAHAERDALAAQVARVESLAEDWRYKGQFGWGPWQIGEGPDPEGYVMDHCAFALRDALAGSEADTTDPQSTEQEDQA